MRRKVFVIGLVIAVCGFLFSMILERHYRPQSIMLFYFQQWPSETIMQTLPLEDLRNAPLQTLWNGHIQPPLYDCIRAIFAQKDSASGPGELLRSVDLSIYAAWAVLYGFLGAVIFWWLSARVGMAVSLLGAVLFLLHPAALFYVTFLDSTFLTTFLIFLTCYLLWRLRENPSSSIIPLITVVLCLFFCRSFIQIAAILVIALSLLLMRVPRRTVMIFVLICGGIAGLYLGKQYVQFGIFNTSSFTGLNLARSIGLRNNYWSYLDLTEPNEYEQTHALPSVLTRKKKITGAPNFNHIRYLDENQFLVNMYADRLGEMSVQDVFLNYIENLQIYLMPSSQYHDVFKTPVQVNVIVDRLPWRQLYDRIFSFPILPFLMLSSGLIWFWSAGWKVRPADIALALPCLYVFCVTVFFEKGENMRFKFFLEPVLYVFIIIQYAELIRIFVRWFQNRQSPVRS